MNIQATRGWLVDPQHPWDRLPRQRESNLRGFLTRQTTGPADGEQARPIVGCWEAWVDP